MASLYCSTSYVCAEYGKIPYCTSRDNSEISKFQNIPGGRNVLLQASLQ